VIKISEEEPPVIVHQILFDRTDRIGIFPHFDYENFPFILRQAAVRE